MARFILFLLMMSPLSHSDETLRDPTRPLFIHGRVKSAAEVWVLQGVYDRQGEKTAVINGQSVKVGESIGTARIEKMSTTSVTVNVKGKLKVLHLRESIK